jgi:hypothetical protein
MGSPSRPSTKDYMPVSHEERIDDGVENPQQEVEAEDDDVRYTTSPHLLSGRSRGNEPPLTVGATCWYHKIGNWRPFRQSRHYASWEAPRKPRTWRQIIMFTFVGFLILAVIAFATATGVLAQKTRSCNRGSYYQPVRNFYTTHIPFGDKFISSNRRLNFAKLYPPIKPSQSACQSAWASLQYVPCHEKIWNRSWDNGKHNSIFDPDVSVYSQAICESRCTEAITQAHQLISSQCTEEDKFDLDNYVGTFSADPELEDSPVGVMDTIAKRIAHTCRQSPVNRDRWNYWQRAPLCSSLMWEDWFIVDGMNAGNLEGLDVFEARTRTAKPDPVRYRPSYENTCDGISLTYGQRYQASRNLGPSVNSTSCSWCTINWFERKLLSWKKDEVYDRKTEKYVSLPDYLKRIREAGQRCDADAWDRTWARAIRQYKLSGELPDNWETEGKTVMLHADVDDEGFVHILPAQAN